VGTDLDRVAVEEGSLDSQVEGRLVEEGIHLGTEEQLQQGLDIRVLLNSQGAVEGSLLGTAGQGKVTEGMHSEEDSLAVEDILQEGNH
jgi:hypothetical protein